MSNRGKPKFQAAGQGRTIAIVGDVYRFLATGAETGGAYASFEALVPPCDAGWVPVLVDQSMAEVLGEHFVDAFCAVKELEYATYNRVISSWEREHLLLLV